MLARGSMCVISLPGNEMFDFTNTSVEEEDGERESERNTMSFFRTDIGKQQQKWKNDIQNEAQYINTKK